MARCAACGGLYEARSLRDVSSGAEKPRRLRGRCWRQYAEARNPDPATHTRDEDCCVDPETGACRVCNVGHGDPAPCCGRSAFHADDCPEMAEVQP